MSVIGLNYCLNSLFYKCLVKMDNFKSGKNKFKYVYLHTQMCIAEKTTLTTRFLDRKMEGYGLLNSEIETLKAEAVQDQTDGWRKKAQ